MAVEARYRAIVSVTDLTSAPLRRINERLEALAAPSRVIGDRFSNMGEQMARFSRNIGLTQVTRSVVGLAGAVGGLVGNIASIAAPWTGLLGVAATTGLAKLTVDVASAGESLVNLSTRTGMSVERLQELQAVARSAGVEANAMTSSIQRLNKGISEAASGKNKDLAAAFNALRINLRGNNGQLRDANALLPELADRFVRLRDQTARTRLATMLFGDAGEALLPMLVRGSAGIQEAADRYRRFGYVMSSEVAARMATAHHQFDDLSMAARGLGTAIGVALAPVLGPVAEDLAKWVVANREWIATGIATKVQELATALREFDWQGFNASVGAHLTKISEWVEAIGGIKTLLIGFGVAAAAPFIASLVSIGAAIVNLTFSVGGLIAKLMLLARVAPGALAGASAAAGASSAAALAGAAAAAGTSVATQAGPAVARAGLLARVAPGMAGLAGIAGPLALGLTVHQGLGLLGQQRDQTGERTREQLANFAQRGRLRGFYGDDPPEDPDDDPVQRPRPPSFTLEDLLPSESLVSREQPEPVGPAGEVQVHVTFDNLPPGARATATTSGLSIAPPTLELGYAFGTLN